MSNSNKIHLDSMSLQDINEDSELIPLLSPDEEDKIDKEELPDVLPILSLRNTVLFPGILIPITMGREKSVKLISDAIKNNSYIGVVAQKDETIDDPKAKDLNNVGVVAKIIKEIKGPNNNSIVLIRGRKRIKIDSFEEEEPYMKAKVSSYPEDKEIKNEEEFNAIIDSVKELTLRVIEESPEFPSEASSLIKNIKSDSFLMHFIASNMKLKVAEKQEVLEQKTLIDRSLLTIKNLKKELQKLRLQSDIHSKTRSVMDKQQREYYLNQQLKSIQDELGVTENENEFEELKEKGAKKKWTKDIAQTFEKELAKLKRMNPQMAEYGVQRNYLELMVELPWNEYSKDKFNLKKSQEILDRDHLGLEKVKDRIIEYLAVLKLRADMKSPIICLYGPPGVGKTSLAKSIAESLGRKYVRMSLGGVRDESEIRGHRKTYIGAMPGRIIKSIKQAGISNPVFVLDEIDKLSNSHIGNPSSAMLEVLDPEQNSEFYDNYLELGYDLSRVLFIATANNLNDIPWALRDRMELINVTGYTVEEKTEIAKRYLFPKQLKEHGLTEKHLKLEDKEITKIVEGYTRESGVRGLEKQVAKVVRSIAKNIALEEDYDTLVSSTKLEEILGIPRLERDKYENNDAAGVVTGLAWTSVGGDILFVESILSKGKGNLSITGNLGKVMKESATIAMKYIKANADTFGIDIDLIDSYDVHIHVPEGATPKDGPSAGITMLTSIISVYTQRKVKSNIAMTGEITLRGKVLPVGGIKEKILAAKRANINEIILCKENKRDIDEIKPSYISDMKFHYVDAMDEVIAIALMDEKVPNAKEFSIDKNKK